MINWLIKAVTVFFLFVVLYWGGNDIVYLLAYIFCFVYLFFREVFSSHSGKEKTAQILLYAVILTTQILMDVLVIRQLLGTETMDSASRLAGIGLMLIPFFTKQSFPKQQEENKTG